MEILDRQLREIVALFALQARTKPVLAEAAMSERDLFIAALKFPDPAERMAWLDGECGGDAALRQRIDLLLQAFDQAGSLLENPAVASGPTIDEPIPEAPGTVIGPYKLLQQIGEGGMGTVYMAEQTAARPAQGRPQGHQAGHGLAARSSPASRPSGRPWR